MSGPSVTRLDTSPVPAFRQPAQDLLMSLFGGSMQHQEGFQGNYRDFYQQNNLNPGLASTAQAYRQAQQPTSRANFDPAGFDLPSLNARLGLSPPSSPLNQQLQSSFMNFLAQPTAAERTFEQQFGGGQTPGMDVLSAAQPIFDRNLAQGTAAINEMGPRFASANLRERGNLAQGALQDFNLFSQQVLESGRNRQVQSAMAADQSRLGGMQAAGQFGLGQSAQDLQFQGMSMQNLQFLLSQMFGAGGFQSAPGFVQNPGTFDQLIRAAGSIGAVAAAV